MWQADQAVAVKQKVAIARKEKRDMFEKHLSFQLKYAYESYARTFREIELKLLSERERAKQPQQAEHANEMIQIWTKAKQDFKRLAIGDGKPKEVETFKMFFNKKGYNSAEEMPQTKLFSLD